MALKNVIGQDRAVSILLRTLVRERLPSAYLFSGESGIGKKFTAVNLAKAVNCLSNTALNHQSTSSNLQPGYPDACDLCSSCKKIAAGTHPDFFIVAPEKNEIRVNEIRAVEEALSLRAYEGRRKVIIVDDSEAMNQSAANAFLKTLEEPPEDSLLVLITSNAEALPETIRSRCSRINFVALSPKACEEVIRTIVVRPDAAKGKKQTTITEGTEDQLQPDLSVVVRLSMGRPGLAISADLIKSRQKFIGLLNSMLKGGSETWTGRNEMAEWLDMAMILMRDMIALRVTGDKAQMFNADLRDYVLDISKKADIRAIIDGFNKLNTLKRKMDFSLNEKITWNYTASLMQTVML